RERGVPPSPLWPHAAWHPEHVPRVGPGSSARRHELRGQGVDAGQHAVVNELQRRANADLTYTTHFPEVLEYGAGALDGGFITRREDDEGARLDGGDAAQHRRFDEL